MNPKIVFFLNNIWEILLSVPKILFFNFRFLPFKDAIRLPIIISYHVKLRGLKRTNFIIKGSSQLRTGSVRLGFYGSDCAYRESKKAMISIEGKGRIEFEGSFGLSQGIMIEAVDGVIKFGENFRSNFSSYIYCKESSVTFGKDVVLGWHVQVKNGDGHCVVENNVAKPLCAPIVIGNHVWLCSYSEVLKGVRIGDNSVVAYRALLTKADGKPGNLYAGCPAKVIRTNINWKE